MSELFSVERLNNNWGLKLLGGNRSRSFISFPNTINEKERRLFKACSHLPKCTLGVVVNVYLALMYTSSCTFLLIKVWDHLIKFLIFNQFSFVLMWWTSIGEINGTSGPRYVWSSSSHSKTVFSPVRSVSRGGTSCKKLQIYSRSLQKIN